MDAPLPSASVSATDTTYMSFDRVVVRGGYPYYVDQLRIRKYAEPEPSASVSGEQGQLETVTTIEAKFVIYVKNVGSTPVKIDSVYIGVDGGEKEHIPLSNLAFVKQGVSSNNRIALGRL